VIRPHWERARQEWRQNRRLRLGCLVAVLILGVHGLLVLSDRRDAMAEQFLREAELLVRLDSASRELAWPQRARAAESELAALRESIPGARTEGVAQAELQTWLTRQAEAAPLQTPTVRVESTLDVPGHPELWQVLARLDASATNLDLRPLLRALSDGLPWVQVERIEIGDGQPMRVAVIVRGYFRKAAGAQSAVPGAVPAASEAGHAVQASQAAAPPALPVSAAPVGNSNP
jgi:hypothetical protein